LSDPMALTTNCSLRSSASSLGHRLPIPTICLYLFSGLQAPFPISDPQSRHGVSRSCTTSLVWFSVKGAILILSSAQLLLISCDSAQVPPLPASPSGLTQGFCSVFPLGFPSSIVGQSPGPGTEQDTCECALNEV
jgi:hypothetical protein